MVSTSMPALRAACLICAAYGLAKGSVSSASTPNSARGGNKLANQLHALAGHLHTPARLSGDVAARPGEARDEAGRDRIARACHHDRNVACRLFRRQRGRREERDDEVDLETDQLGSLFQLEIGPASSRAYLQAKIAALDVARIAQALAQCLQERFRVRQGKDTDRVHPHLLRACQERPTRRRTAEQRDQLASFHSITSSARASSVAGTARPSILAVSALMTSSNLLDCTTGRSPGFAPLRMRPV